MKDGKYRILLVDDEENVLRALSRSLRKEPYDVVTASSAKIALDYFIEEPFDLVISDYKMPRFNGIELLTRIHDDYPDSAMMLCWGVNRSKKATIDVSHNMFYSDDTLSGQIDRWHRRRSNRVRGREKWS